MTAGDHPDSQISYPAIPALLRRIPVEAAGDEFEPVENGGMLVGAVLLAIAMFRPFLVVHYAPTGGSAVVNGHRISAFTDKITDKITGWQFAQTAKWSHILLLFVLLAGRLAMFISKGAIPIAFAFALTFTFAFAAVDAVTGWHLDSLMIHWIDGLGQPGFG